MKKKFSKILGVGLALALLASMLVMAAPVQATPGTKVTDVWVGFTEDPWNKENAETGFTIHFTPKTDMKRGIDKITVIFPNGESDMGPVAFNLSAALTDNSYYLVGTTAPISNVVLNKKGYFITVVTPVDLAKDTAASLKILKAAKVKTANSTSHSPYYIKVYTTKDTTPKLSDPFDLDTDGLGAVSLALSTAVAGEAAAYTFTLDNADETALGIGDTVTFIFPKGTTIPAQDEIVAADVTWSANTGGGWTLGNETPVINQAARMITVTTPIDLDTSATANLVKFFETAGIVNPTTAATHKYYACTSEDELLLEVTKAITAGTATQIIVADGEIGLATKHYSDDASMIDMYSSQIYVTCADKYGNAVVDATTVDLTTSGTGEFYVNSDATPGSGTYSVATQLDVDAASPADADQQVYYKGTVAGEVTLTFEDAATTSPLESATWTFTVAPAVSLIHEGVEVQTFGPPSATPTAEIKATSGSGSVQAYASDYIQDAIDAAVTGDTVKLGDGIYEFDADSLINLDEKITLTSANGALSTTLRNIEDINNPLIKVVDTDGKELEPIIIDGFTFQRLKNGIDIQGDAVKIQRNYVTVRNCIFNNINPDANSQSEATIYINTSSVDITSLTISDNIFTDCGPLDLAVEGRAAVISAHTDSYSHYLTGLTISGNTFTGGGEYGIELKGSSTKRLSATISNNIFTNCQGVICLSDTKGPSTYLGRVTVIGNKFTNSYNYAIKVESGNNQVKIKNNTITGTIGDYAVIVEDSEESTHTVQYNAIKDNNNYAIKGTGDTHAAQYNWYGSATGPTVSTNVGGTGDKVTSYVDYSPWLYETLATVVTDNISYPTFRRSLAVGWNTLSTPGKLLSTANTIEELIPPLGPSAGYYFEGTWKELTPSYELKPCDAVYVKMSSAQTVLLKVDGAATSVPTKELAAGWNLIGLASLTTKTDIEATASILTTSFGQIVSPSINASEWVFISGTTQGTLAIGEGYWIYVNSAANIGGFTILPLAPSLK